MNYITFNKNSSIFQHDISHVRGYPVLVTGTLPASNMLDHLSQYPPLSQRAFSWEDNQFLSWHCPWHEQRGWKQSQKEAVLRRSGSSSSGASFPLAGSSVSWAPAGSAAFHYPARGQITGVQLGALDPLILWRKGGWRLSVVQTYVLDQFKVTVTCFRDLL